MFQCNLHNSVLALPAKECLRQFAWGWISMFFYYSDFTDTFHNFDNWLVFKILWLLCKITSNQQQFVNFSVQQHPSLTQVYMYHKTITLECLRTLNPQNSTWIQYFILVSRTSIIQLPDRRSYISVKNYWTKFTIQQLITIHNTCPQARLNSYDKHFSDAKERNRNVRHTSSIGAMVVSACVHKRLA